MNTVTVQLANSLTQREVEGIRTLLGAVAQLNPAWRGTEFKIVRGEGICLPYRADADARFLTVCILGALGSTTAH